MRACVVDVRRHGRGAPLLPVLCARCLSATAATPQTAALDVSGFARCVINVITTNTLVQLRKRDWRRKPTVASFIFMARPHVETNTAPLFPCQTRVKQWSIYFFFFITFKPEIFSRILAEKISKHSLTERPMKNVNTVRARVCATRQREGHRPANLLELRLKNNVLYKV